MSVVVVAIASVITLLFAFQATGSQFEMVSSPPAQEQTAGKPKTKPMKSTSSKETLEKQWRDELYRISELLEKGQQQKAIQRWEHLRSMDKRPLTWELLASKLSQVYVALNRVDDAIKTFERFYIQVDNLTVKQRAAIGEELIFGELGARFVEKGIPVGKGQCTACHRFQDGPHGWAGPNLFGVVARARALVQAEAYINRPKNTDQPEAFPESGIATSAIEYLAESKVCPSCYIVLGTWFHRNDWNKSPQSRLHKPPINLTIDEMIAIDTWLFVQEGDEPPPVESMRAGYDKFIKEEERAGSFAGVKLAAQYDAKLDTEAAIRLLAENYDGVVRQSFTPPSLSPALQSYPSMMDEDLTRWRNDPGRFRHLKQNPLLADRFPELLRSATSWFDHITDEE